MMAAVRQLIWLIPILVLATAGGFIFFGQRDYERKSDCCFLSWGSGKDGSPCCSVSDTSVKYSVIEAAVKEQKGKLVLIDFWATWCAPCVKKLPIMVDLHNKYGEKGLSCISVSLDSPKDADDVNALLTKKGAKFTNFILRSPTKGEEENMKEKFGYDGGIPHMALIGRDGKKIGDVWSWYPEGKFTEKELATKLDKLIEDELAKK